MRATGAHAEKMARKAGRQAGSGKAGGSMRCTKGKSKREGAMCEVGKSLEMAQRLPCLFETGMKMTQGKDKWSQGRLKRRPPPARSSGEREEVSRK